MTILLWNNTQRNDCQTYSSTPILPRHCSLVLHLLPVTIFMFFEIKFSRPFHDLIVFAINILNVKNLYPVEFNKLFTKHFISIKYIISFESCNVKITFDSAFNTNSYLTSYWFKEMITPLKYPNLLFIVLSLFDSIFVKRKKIFEIV